MSTAVLTTTADTVGNLLPNDAPHVVEQFIADLQAYVTKWAEREEVSVVELWREFARYLVSGSGAAIFQTSVAHLYHAGAPDERRDVPASGPVQTYRPKKRRGPKGLVDDQARTRIILRGLELRNTTTLSWQAIWGTIRAEGIVPPERMPSRTRLIEWIRG